ncbi:MAG: ATP-binding protein [candidate division WOR-3 bacterium]
MVKIKQFIKEKIAEIKREVGKEKVLVATSGGVDSLTCALLGFRAVKENLSCVFIDDGLMRLDEGKEVAAVLKRFKIPLKIYEYRARFFSTLKGLTDPEEKRRAFRDAFYNTLGEILKKENAKFLIQGTIKADIVETKGGIKTQHNVLEQIGINPETYGLKILEPLKDLYKDEVRKVAKALGLPKAVYQRMPFPGPGLATRILGEVTPERVAILQKATKIVEGMTKRIPSFQTFAVLLSDRATGQKEGKRVFGEIIALRSVQSKNALTAKITPLPYPLLAKITKKIVEECPTVVKVLYDITPKPPSTIEWI